MKFYIFSALLWYFSVINLVVSLSIECNFDNELLFDDLKVAYSCSVLKLVVINESERTITEVKGGHVLVPGSKNEDIKQLYIIRQIMAYFPKNFPKFFEHVVAIHAGYNGLKYLEKDDLKVFDKLRFLYLYNNKLEFLQSDLFHENIHLEYVSLHSNRLKHIGSKMLAPLKNLKTAYFNKNICIDKQAVHSEHDVAELRLEIAQKCSDITDEDLFLNLKDNQMKLSQIEQKIDSLFVMLQDIFGNSTKSKTN